MTRVLRLLLLLSLAAPGAAAAQLAKSEKAVFVIRHGADTVATEEVERGPNVIDGTLTTRGVQRVAERYHAVVGPDATLPLVEITVREESDTGRVKSHVAQRVRVIFKGDSVAVDDLGGTGMLTLVMATEHGAVPYINLSFGLLEQAIRRAGTLGTGQAQIAFFNLSRKRSYAGDRPEGGQTLRGTLSRIGADSLSLALGSIEFRLNVDREGRLLGGGIPAQQLSFVRTSGD